MSKYITGEELVISDSYPKYEGGFNAGDKVQFIDDFGDEALVSRNSDNYQHYVSWYYLIKPENSLLTITSELQTMRQEIYDLQKEVRHLKKRLGNI